MARRRALRRSHSVRDRAEPVARDLGHLQEADPRSVGEDQVAPAGRFRRGDRPDVGIGEITRIGDTEALAPDDR
ncbi:MAG: hypothetical protein M0Z95_09330, partial [Actinomycetota bacterium]|nr:hypothetical protein [Actinomycetota bacterium]